MTKLNKLGATINIFKSGFHVKAKKEGKLLEYNFLSEYFSDIEDWCLFLKNARIMA